MELKASAPLRFVNHRRIYGSIPNNKKGSCRYWLGPFLFLCRPVRIATGKGRAQKQRNRDQ